MSRLVDNTSGSLENRNPNENCLAGKRCQNCGSYGPFEIVVLTKCVLFDSGTNDSNDGSVEFDEGSPAKCCLCNYTSNWGDFDDGEKQ